MTRKDSEKIAAVLKSTDPDNYPDIAIKGKGYEFWVGQWNRDRVAIADMLALDNPRFNRDRFYAASWRPQRGGGQS